VAGSERTITMSTHTSGEWRLHPSYGENEVGRVFDQYGVPGWEYLDVPIAAGETLIGCASARRAPNPGWPRVTDWEECRANARLMIAAPVMLAALESLVHADDPLCKCPACKVGKPAIAKARGENDKGERHE